MERRLGHPATSTAALEASTVVTRGQGRLPGAARPVAPPAAGMVVLPAKDTVPLAVALLLVVLPPAVHQQRPPLVSMVLLLGALRRAAVDSAAETPCPRQSRMCSSSR